MTIEPESDEALAERFRTAGPRPPIPAEDQAYLRDVAASAWRRMVAAERRKRRRRVVYGAAAASLALAALAGWIWLARPSAPRGAPQPVAIGASEPGVRLASGETYAAPGPVALRMTTGESLRLQAGTRLRFVSGARVELLDGAIYVDSGPAGSAAGAGLEVVTAAGLVREIGTQYEVRHETGAVTVSVREGRVRIDHGDESSVLERGERIRVAGDGPVVRESVATCRGEWSWAAELAPAFAIEGRPLADYLDWIARETGCTVTFADAELARSAGTIRLHGSIAGFLPEESLDVVLPGAGLEHEVTASSIRVVRTDR